MEGNKEVYATLHQQCAKIGSVTLTGFKVHINNDYYRQEITKCIFYF